jgi:hypothetical protein
MGFADIHIHAIYSYDATTTMQGVLKQASSVGLNVIVAQTMMTSAARSTRVIWHLNTTSK